MTGVAAPCLKIHVPCIRSYVTAPQVYIYFLQEMTKTIPILGSRQIGPRQIGPLENVGAANWAPGILLGQGCKNYIPKYLVHKYSYTNTA